VRQAHALPGHHLRSPRAAPTAHRQGTTLTSVEALEPTLLSIAGSRPAARNPEDARVIETIRTRGGRIIDHVDEVRVAWPASSSRAPMLPDAPQSDADGNGYTRLEEWLHEQSVAVTQRP